VAAQVDTEGAIYVLFRLGSEEYGLPIARVSSIIRYETATPVPRAPEIVMGVINMRGRVIPVLDLTKRLVQVEFEPGPSARIIVAEGAAGTVGLAVDAASEVVTIPESAIRPAPEGALSAETANAFEGVAEIGDRLVILLDLDEAVPKAEYAQVGLGDDSEGSADV
jgi:purine-binding chemotaxis protein CheW